MPRQSKSIVAQLPDPEAIDYPALFRKCRDSEIDLLVILGPTASGKTSLAVRLASQMGGCEIISADSRQVYRGMDIGTGKDLGEYGEILYHLIDITNPGQPYNVFEFKKDFTAALEDIRSRGKFPILCGGTGLYINAVTAGYDFRTSKPLSSGGSAGMGGNPVRNPFFIGTLVSREVRNERIDARLDERLAQGMAEEIRGLLDNGVPASVLIGYGLEYKFVTQYILGELSFAEMRERLAIAIHQFAKRQMTWFRGMERSGVCIHWVAPH